MLEEGEEAPEEAGSQEAEVEPLAVRLQAQEGREEQLPQSCPRHPHHDHAHIYPDLSHHHHVHHHCQAGYEGIGAPGFGGAASAPGGYGAPGAEGGFEGALQDK